MIYEFFMFHNELDMLELKLKTHAPWVDRFIIIESNVRSNQSPKDYVLLNHMDRYSEYQHKITYLKHDGVGLEPGWVTINNQRNLADRQISFQPNDIIIISDLDEFLTAEDFDAVQKHFEHNTQDLKFEMTCYWCYADLQHQRKQRGITAVLGKSFKQSSTHRHQDIAQHGKRMDVNHVRTGGIHLSWFGNKQQFEEKILGSIEGLQYIGNKLENIDLHWRKKTTGHLFNHMVKFANKKIQRVDFATNTEIPPSMKEFIQSKPEWLLNSKESS